jgi:hypothetical protein
LIIEPMQATPLRALLVQWSPLDETFPEIDSLPAEPSDLRPPSERPRQRTELAPNHSAQRDERHMSKRRV